MADPFSICLGVITVLGTARKVCNGLVKLRAAPREIEELRNALQNLTAVLERVVETIQSAAEPDKPNDLLQLALDEATRIADPLYAFLRELTSGIEASAFRKGVERVNWSRKREIIRDYTVRLVNVKVSLMFAMQAEQM